MDSPGKMKVDLRTPPELAPTPKPKTNDTTDNPKQKSIATATASVPITTGTIPATNDDIKANPKTTLDPPSTSAPMLPAPNPSKDAPQHIHDPLLGA